MSVFCVVLMIVAILCVLLEIGGILLVQLTFRRPKPYVRGKQLPPEATEAERRYESKLSRSVPWAEERRREEWKTAAYDGISLSAAWFPAESPTGNTVLCVHGFRSSGLFDFGEKLPFLHEAGWNILLPDDRGFGKSGGKYLGFGIQDSEDVLSWCRELVKRQGESCRIVLFGVSMGGAAVWNAAGDDALPEQVRGVIGDCGFSDGYEEVKKELRETYHLPAFPLLPVADWNLKLLAGYSLKDRVPLERIGKVKMPLLLIHGEEDRFVPYAMGQALFEAAEGDKTFLSVPGAAHARSDIAAPEVYRETVLRFLAKTEDVR